MIFGHFMAIFWVFAHFEPIFSPVLPKLTARLSQNGYWGVIARLLFEIWALECCPIFVICKCPQYAGFCPKFSFFSISTYYISLERHGDRLSDQLKIIG